MVCSSRWFFENVKILQQLIKNQCLKRKEYNTVFIDLAKAFDTVYDKSIINSLKRKWVLQQVTSTIMEMYPNSFTATTVGGKTTRHIKTNSGFKQGCPLSSLLFNLKLDELTEKLKSLGIGIRINDQLVSVMAFIDELVLITEHSSHMTLPIKKYQKFLNLKGLSINVGKCGSLRVLPVKLKKAMKGLPWTKGTWQNF